MASAIIAVVAAAEAAEAAVPVPISNLFAVFASDPDLLAAEEELFAADEDAFAADKEPDEELFSAEGDTRRG